MMEVERRVETKRMHIEKRVALYVPGKKKAYAGVTRNMSDAGICAGFKKLPKDGEDVLLHVYWQEDKPPIEQAASLVWTSPNMPDGIVRVGLRLKDEPMGRASTTATAPSPSCSYPGPAVVSPTAAAFRVDAPQAPAVLETTPASQGKPVIEKGAEVRLLVGGVAIDTVAASIGDIQEDNTVQIVLEIVDPAFGNNASEGAFNEALPEEQDWSPHPFRDAWRTFEKHAGPAAAVTSRMAMRLLNTLAVLLAPLLRKIKRSAMKRLLERQS